MLNIDQFFFKAIDSNASIKALVSNRIFNTRRDKDAEAQDKIPYIIIHYDGGTSSEFDKDTIVSALDKASVTILGCAETRNDLANLMDLIVDAIKYAFDNYDTFMESSWKFGIDSAIPSADDLDYDQEKPCYFQSLTYTCDTYKR